MKNVPIYILAIFTVVSAAAAETRRVHSNGPYVSVHGYLRSNGTYVSPYLRAYPGHVLRPLTALAINPNIAGRASDAQPSSNSTVIVAEPKPTEQKSDLPISVPIKTEPPGASTPSESAEAKVNATDFMPECRFLLANNTYIDEIKSYIAQSDKFFKDGDKLKSCNSVHEAMIRLTNGKTQMSQCYMKGLDNGVPIYKLTYMSNSTNSLQSVLYDLSDAYHDRECAD